MLGLLITLAAILGVSCVMVVASYMRTRDLIANNKTIDGLTEVLDKQKWSALLHIAAILLIVGYTGTIV